MKNVSAGYVYDANPELGENFVVSAALRGVRNIELKPKNGVYIDATQAAALSFGFAEPTKGGDRCLLGVTCQIRNKFLAQIKQVCLSLAFPWKYPSVQRVRGYSRFEEASYSRQP